MDAPPQACPQGLVVCLPDRDAAARAQAEIESYQTALGLPGIAQIGLDTSGPQVLLSLCLAAEPFKALCDGFDTLALRSRLASEEQADSGDALLRETWVALLAAPQQLAFDSVAELQSHLRICCHIARAAQKTALAFHTSAMERPAEFWVYDEERGFLLSPGADLVSALIAATQPEATGRRYDFSCYRATEYVILLGIALEAQAHAPALYQQLVALNRHTCIKSGRFHDTYLFEYGTVDAPLPMRYYVPGDRVWFKNPDEASADVSGYEGSWVIYLGGGLFSNFWERDQPYTMAHKALEIYHWRHGTHQGADGELQMDEARVAEQVRCSQAQPAELERIVSRMTRYRDPAGAYAQGGCIDASREFALPLARLRLP